ncbi:LuxR C-terminal-related transcriptional regulator [Draconibacterium sp. IB214405]|uniref:LuxR C-terminal-related transcriptional regulator n=1 Tax=Draconibacterium sp. IB214405 TaxID=3097352 RepID=UPI002A177C8B|nr:LuxR C-terminal-related transcriptional regulator [Draconibacterium sp. IB214405]MDX8339038.1 LuxR C-terminal-related transcriptional regulator [Draconibacterium sp. IB214405]
MDFLRARLTRPILNSNFLKRERITSVLNRNKSKALSLIIAAAGYGKSITVSQWLDQLDEKYCWIDLGENCNEFKVFVEYIIEAVKTVFPDLLVESLKMINSQEVDSHKIITESVISELLDVKEDFYIVLDDYHLVHNSNIHYLVEMILKYLSPKIHMVIISRNDPSLKVSHLFAYDNACEIRGKDLRFTEEEIAELSEQVYNNKLNAEQISSVLFTTEGWIIAVRLHLKILSEGLDLSASLAELQNKQESLMEHMLHEVITTEQDDIFKGLLLASVSERFTVDLIVRLMESDTTNNTFDANLFRNRFKETLKNSMFIYAIDHEKKWYRFHRLVHDLMCKKIKQRYCGSQIKKFYIEASRYFEAIHSYEEGLQTALFGEDVDFAISIIISNYNILLDSEQFQRLGSWLNMLPVGTVETHPELLVIRAALREAKYDLHGLASDLEILGKIINPLDKDTEEGRRILGGYYAFSAGSFFFSRDYERALEMADEALPLLKENYTYLLSYTIIMRSMTLQILGSGDEANKLTDSYLEALPEGNRIAILRAHLCNTFVKSMQGKIDKISVSANLIIELSRENKKWVTYAMANYYLAASNYYRNKKEGVLSIYQDSRKNGFAGRPNFILQTGFFAALQMHSENDSDGFKQIIAELYSYIRKFNKSDFRNIITAFELEHELMHGDLEKARELATHVDFSDYPSIFYFYVPSLTKIKLMLADPDNWDVEETRVELEELIQRKEKLHLNHLLVQAYPLLAIWHNRYGDKEEALFNLRKTISLAEEGGFVRIFLDLGEEMHSLFDALESREKRTPFIDKILNGFHYNYGRDVQPAIVKPNKKQKEVSKNSIVTPRETEILQLIVKGHSNKEIADLLFLSLGTIKTYAYSIYQKIEVKNRVEAINKAYEMGIVTSMV